MLHSFLLGYLTTQTGWQSPAVTELGELGPWRGGGDRGGMGAQGMRGAMPPLARVTCGSGGSASLSHMNSHDIPAGKALWGLEAKSQGTHSIVGSPPGRMSGRDGAYLPSPMPAKAWGSCSSVSPRALQVDGCAWLLGAGCGVAVRPGASGSDCELPRGVSTQALQMLECGMPQTGLVSTRDAPSSGRARD